MITLFLFVVLFALLILGMPIAIALGLSSLLTILLFANDSLASLVLKFFQTMEQFTLLAIPFFILAGNFMTTGGVARRMIDFAVAAVGHLPGGLAIASVLACMLFAAVSGSSPATVVAIGSIVIGGMVRIGYSRDFAAGIIVNAGTLGILIPPSIVMVVYAAATESSVGRLFIAGVVPGILLGAALMFAIYLVARVKKLPRQPKASWAERLRTFLVAFFGLLLIVIVLGGIYAGAFTPTEAAAVSAVYAFFTAVAIYRDIGPLKGEPWLSKTEMAGMSRPLAMFVRAALRNLYLIARGLVLAPFHRDVHSVLVEASKMTVMLMFIIANAFLFAHVLTTEQIPQSIARGLIGSGLSAWQFLLIVNILLLIAGNFMEPSAIILILAPILFPIAMQLGIDPIHLGIIMVVNMEIGMVTPPVGLNLFVASGITKMPILSVVRAALPWLMVLIGFLIVITYIPAISLTLPNMMFAAPPQPTLAP